MKKFLSISSFVLFSLLVLNSCGKKRTLHIKAINTVTGQPYVGLSFGISATKTGIVGESALLFLIRVLNE